MNRLDGLVRRLPPAPVLLGWLVVAHVVLKLLLFPLVAQAQPFGDEQAYLNGGMALSNAVRDLGAFTTPDWAELDRNVVASGWFMPGMSVVVAPLYLVAPDAGPALLRGYLGLCTLVLWVVVLRHVVRTLGPRWAVVLAVFPGLVPMWVMFGFGAYGDLWAGLVLLLIVLRIVEMVRGFRRGEAPTVRNGVVLGLLAVAALYLRSSTSVVLAGLGVVTLVAALTLLTGPARRRAVASALAAAGVFLALLAPWSAYASEVLGGRVVTTTTVPTVRANTFGDPDEVCFGDCDPDSTLWFAPVRYAREVARSTGTSEVDVLPQMSSYALRDLTVAQYLGKVDYNLASYSLQPATFVDHMAPEGGRGPVGTVGGWAVKVLTWLLYFPVLALAAASLLTVARRSVEARVLDLLVKVTIGGLLVQPFVHLGGGRYWTTAGPFLAIAAATFVRERLVARVPAPVGAPPPAESTFVRWVGRVQRLLAVLTAVVAVAIAAAAVAGLLGLAGIAA